MVFSLNSLGFTLIVVFLTAQTSEAMYLSKYDGELDKMPENCAGMTFCRTKHENKTQEKIDKLLTEKYNLTLASARGEPYERRSSPDFEDLCKKNITYGLIYEIVDENNRVRKVVQSENLFKQMVRIEQCVPKISADGENSYDDGENDEYDDEYENDEAKSCKDHKMDFSFLVLTLDGKGVEFVNILDGIPVCCS